MKTFHNEHDGKKNSWDELCWLTIDRSDDSFPRYPPLCTPFVLISQRSCYATLLLSWRVLPDFTLLCHFLVCCCLSGGLLYYLEWKFGVSRRLLLSLELESYRQRTKFHITYMVVEARAGQGRVDVDS